MTRRSFRKVVNLLALGLSGLATAIGLMFLGAILWTLREEGRRGHCPPPSSPRARRRPEARAAADC